MSEEGQTAAPDLESELQKLVDMARKTIQEAVSQAKMVLANTSKIEERLAEELERAGIQTLEMELDYGQEYDLGMWRLEGKWLVPPHLDDEEAEIEFEKVFGNHCGLDFETGKYSRSVPREWSVRNANLFWAGALF